MPSDKDRLYVALYARGGAPTMPGLEDTYHWAFIVGPKSESGTSQGFRFHAKERLSFVGNPPVAQSVWQYEETEILMAPSSMLLVRIMVGKVKSIDRLRSIFERTPVRPEIDGWNCVAWVKEALLAAIQDSRALGTSAGGWQEVRDTAMLYVKRKKEAHRFDGTVYYDPTQAATWDMLSGVELVP
ncbi:hypothetical protein LY78DRAFT_589696 [Colletotrichum sublineola]|uniref:Uncharacterized protein n=1 Tax=Colletotrichum sublineola TaxID=1173701 RepID=A0A066XUT0_COLSU|nr:hypothetical protein LY78DRAFT_589696 [Colletotrichum sublineola]KDN71464.1 putative conserved hypothetical protein [Colletotrichum sublineola]